MRAKINFALTPRSQPIPLTISLIHSPTHFTHPIIPNLHLLIAHPKSHHFHTQIGGNVEKRWPWVHILDLGQAYVTVADAHLAGKDVVKVLRAGSFEGSRPYKEMRLALAKAAGYRRDDFEHVAVPTGIEAFIDVDVDQASSDKQLAELKALGWTPLHHPGPLVDIDVIYAAFRAHADSTTVSTRSTSGSASGSRPPSRAASQSLLQVPSGSAAAAAASSAASSAASAAAGGHPPANSHGTSGSSATGATAASGGHTVQ